MAVVTIQQSVAALYVAVFNRAPDEAGLNAWTATITSGQMTFAQVAAGFAAHEVFTAGIGTLSNTDFVAALYQNILGSAGDAGGIANWTNQLNAGLSKADVAALFVQAALTVDIPAMLAAGSLTAAEAAAATVRQQTLTNKADVGIYFANTLGAASNLNPLTVSSSKAGLEADPIYNASKAAIANVTDSLASVAAAKDAIAVAAGSSDPAQSLLGGTFMLTKGLDNYQGTSGNDTIIGSVSKDAELNTFSALDIIDGGAGTDTLKVSSEGYIAPVAAVTGPPAVAAVAESGKIVIGANVKNVEIVEASSAGALNVDTTGSAGVTTLNLTGAATSVEAKAAATTDVNATFAAQAASTVDINGGKNVTVKLSDAVATNTVVVGTASAPADSPAGDVVVDLTGKALTATSTGKVLADVNVYGGKTISVTQKIGDAAALKAAATADVSVQQGAVNVFTNAITTEVTAKQDVAAEKFTTPVTKTGVAAVESIKFTAAVKDQTINVGGVGGLTFTASKALTAAEVAAAFAGLTNSNVLAASGSAATGDTQANVVTANGKFSGSLAGWTTGAANGETVTFTKAGAPANQSTASLSAVYGAVAASSTATSTVNATLVTQGVGKDGGDEFTLTKQASAVTINTATADALTTINVDGYTTGSTTAAASKLANLNLKNGGQFTVAGAAETLNVSLEKVGVSATPAALSLGTATKVLNVVSTGANFADLTATAAEAVTVDGTGLLTANGSKLGAAKSIVVKGAAGLNLGTDAVTVNNATLTNLETVNTTATTGAVSVTVDGAKVTYQGGAGNDTVRVTGTEANVNKTIDLGAGDNKLDLSANTTGAAYNTAAKFVAGAGTNDVIKLAAVGAAKLSENGTFEKQFSGFEKLELTKLAGTTAKTVNLDNLNDISYVISGNTAATAPGLAVVTAPTGTLNAGDGTSTSTTYTGVVPPALLAGQSVTIAGWTVKAVADTSAADVLAVFGGTATATQGLKFDAASITGSFTGWNGVVNTGVLDFTAADFATVTAPAITGSAATDATLSLSLTNMLNNGTLELNENGAGVSVVMKDASGASDAFNIVANAGTSTDNSFDNAANLGTVNVDKVEAINIASSKTYEVTDATTQIKSTKGAFASVTLDADAAKVVNVTGAGGVKLTLANDTKAVITTIDASSNTGGVHVDLGAGATNAVTITGGAGADLLKASTGAESKADVLVGGAGVDTLFAGSNAATLTGGADNDVFVLNTAGNLSVNSYSTITDFAVGDVLSIGTSFTFAKLATVVQGTTEVSAFANAAIKQAGANEAVYFTIGSDSYVVVDNGTTAATDETFKNGEDVIIKLTGVNLDNASFNSQYGTVELV